MKNTYDIIIIGAGHAGVEAGLAGARLGKNVLMLSLSLDNIAYMACNPALGGTAKGHLIREIDALGGQMGVASDENLIQLRMLNTSKGQAAQSLRAQADKYKYHTFMKRVVEKQARLTVLQAEVRSVEKVDATWQITTSHREKYSADAVIVASGVYLNSDIIIGTTRERKGPSGFSCAVGLSDSLKKLGFELRRFKTGTPPRVFASSLDFSQMEIQEGMSDIYPFSFLTNYKKFKNSNKASCYLTYTNEKTHDIIRENLHLSPMHNGSIRSTGARYCPSIEDKIFRFPDKIRHQVFVEPEGEGTDEMYIQGVSSALPVGVQRQIINSIIGMQNARIARYAYAIEYDCIDSLELGADLQSKAHKGLYFAGQINGTSGYEEAAAQGLIAGINAVLRLNSCESLVLRRDEGYIGVLIDDLVSRGTNEPYRMMTARAEYRLRLRQENADLRLTPHAIRVGLADSGRVKLFKKRVVELEKLRQIVPVEKLKKMDYGVGELLVDMPELAKFDLRNVKEIETEIKYAGYLARQDAIIHEQRRLSEMKLPVDFDYSKVMGLRIEAAQKLNAIKPESLAQAGRISGVNPSDVTVLMVYLKRLGSGLVG